MKLSGGNASEMRREEHGGSCALCTNVRVHSYVRSSVNLGVILS